MFERSLEEQNITHIAQEFSSCSSLRACVQRGLGLTICPIVSIRRELEQDSLKVLNWQQTFTSVIMLRHTDKWCSPLLKRFMEIAIAEII